MECYAARPDTSPGADGVQVCGVCGRATEGAGDTLRHVGDAFRPPIVSAKADMAMVRRAQAVIERVPDGVEWALGVTNEDSALAAALDLYRDGMIAGRQRDVRPRSTKRPRPSRPVAGAPERGGTELNLFYVDYRVLPGESNIRDGDAFFIEVVP
ncbi:hypothetical protein [Spirillospora sp. NPDC047279]|uniref:hypothetical protein n=1 Tax=Spirillospora sp. NPDC047279 TaxID=3155478 RepID=UPI0033CB4CAE